MASILKKLCKWVAIGLAVLLVCGAVAEQVCRARFEARRPALDGFREIDGRQIHFVRRGTGSPCVVFQSGLGSDYRIWEAVQERLAQRTTTVSYDRAGLLWSDPGPRPPTLQSINRELKGLLERIDCPKPYILVGHSLAGITLRPFINDHSRDIAGVVFVDVAHPRQIQESSAQLREAIVPPPEWLVTALMDTGLFRALYSIEPLVPDFPVDHWYNRHARDSFFKSYRATLELARHDEPMFAESAAISTFGNIPLAVITAAYPHGTGFGFGDGPLAQEYLSIHRRLQRDLLNLSSDSRQIVATRSGHYVPLQEPELIVGAVERYLTPSAQGSASTPPPDSASFR